MKRIVSLLIVAMLLMTLAACGEETYSFTDIAALPEGGDEAVVALFGEGEQVYESDGVTMFAREYTIKTLGKKCSVSVIYNNGMMTQIALYFNDKASTFSDLGVELWSIYGESDHTFDNDNGMAGQIWLLDTGDAVYLKKTTDGTSRVTVECAVREGEK